VLSASEAMPVSRWLLLSVARGGHPPNTKSLQISFGVRCGLANRVDWHAQRAAGMPMLLTDVAVQGSWCNTTMHLGQRQLRGRRRAGGKRLQLRVRHLDWRFSLACVQLDCALTRLARGTHCTCTLLQTFKLTDQSPTRIIL
jgi:hypothetical protein